MHEDTADRDRPEDNALCARAAELEKRGIGKWEDFLLLAQFFTQRKANHYIFRGQADVEWGLVPSLARPFRPRRVDDVGLALKIEEKALNKFHRDAHLFLPANLVSVSDKDKVYWWMLMQHHGAPTRLLDWTHSPYAGLYFSTEDYGRDGALWCCDQIQLAKHMCAKYNREPWVAEFFKSGGIQSTDAPRDLIVCDSTRRSQRQAVQQGVFTLCKQVLTDHREALEEAGCLFKFKIPKELKAEFQYRLVKANVTGVSLFPDIDGLGRFIRDQVYFGLHYGGPAVLPE